MTIYLTLNPCQVTEELTCQHLHIEIASLDGIIEPQDLTELKLPEGINWRQGVIIEGKAPVWIYGFLVHECHPARWIGCYDPRIGAVIVSTHSREVRVGQILPVTLT